MAELTITGTATATIDGLTTSVTATQIATIREYMQLTKDVSGSASQVFNGGWGFCVVCNVGAVEIIAEVGVSADFMIFSVPPGAHLVIPNAIASTGGAMQSCNGLTLYTASSSSRAIIAIGIY